MSAGGAFLRAIAGGVALAMVLAALPGCGDATLAPVSGTVSIAGKPACGGKIIFLPDGGGRPAIGNIGSDGRFSLTTGGSDEGAAIAAHHIVLKDVLCAGDAKGKNYRTNEVTRLQVQGGAGNAFDINVDVKNGWQEVLDD
jgi:hypothetical protein